MKKRKKPQGGPPGDRVRGLLHDIYKNRMIYLLISPFFLIYAIFWIFPIFYSFFLSFHKWGGVGEKKFVGLFYFQHLLQDSTFLLSIKNTLIIWVLSTIPMVILAVVLAFLLNGAFLKGKNFFRTVYYLPNITSTVAIAIVFANIFGNKYGILNFLISRLGFDPVQWMSLTWGVHVAIAAIVIWRWTGYNAIILLAGLQKIPSSLYEAASLDGASTFQIFRYDPVCGDHLHHWRMAAVCGSPDVSGHGGRDRQERYDRGPLPVQPGIRQPSVWLRFSYFLGSGCDHRLLFPDQLDDYQAGGGLT